MTMNASIPQDAMFLLSQLIKTGSGKTTNNCKRLEFAAKKVEAKFGHEVAASVREYLGLN
jgi:hypothetical protein